jgi:hypothetical protein
VQVLSMRISTLVPRTLTRLSGRASPIGFDTASKPSRPASRRRRAHKQGRKPRLFVFMNIDLYLNRYEVVPGMQDVPSRRHSRPRLSGIEHENELEWSTVRR